MPVKRVRNFRDYDYAQAKRSYTSGQPDQWYVRETDYLGMDKLVCDPSPIKWDAPIH